MAQDKLTLNGFDGCPNDIYIDNDGALVISDSEYQCVVIHSDDIPLLLQRVENSIRITE